MTLWWRCTRDSLDMTAGKIYEQPEDGPLVDDARDEIEGSRMDRMELVKVDSVKEAMENLRKDMWLELKSGEIFEVKHIDLKDSEQTFRTKGGGWVSNLRIQAIYYVDPATVNIPSSPNLAKIEEIEATIQELQDQVAELKANS